MSANQQALLAEDIHKRFGEVEVLKGISVEADKGDVIAILGASGSGKSTFLRCINLLETPNAGRIVVAGERVPLSEPLRALWGADTLLRAVGAGDDYQVAFTGPPGLDGPFTAIGAVESGHGVSLTVAGREVAVPRPGYRHF